MNSESELITVNPLMALPFCGLLAVIALAPLFFADWWGRHYPKVVAALAAIVVVYYIGFLQRARAHPICKRPTSIHQLHRYRW